MGKPKRNYTTQHSSEMLEMALQLMKDKKISSYQAEKQFGIPRRTLLDKLHKKHALKVGCPTRLTKEEEEKIVNVLIAAGDFGSPLTLLDLRLIVQRYLERNGRAGLFDGNLPGKKFAYSFLKRHKNKLTFRATQNIKRSRAEKNYDEIATYFTNLEKSLSGIPKNNIINYDETNLSDNPGSSKCLFRRGVKYPERIINHTKGSISIMFAITAGGDCLPPYVVYKAQYLYKQWTINGPPQARYNRTSSGWFDAAIFIDWFENIILPWASNNPGPKLLIGDNLASHLDPDVVRQCEENNIKFVFLPPNSSHLTQPLDVCYFGPLKKIWRSIILSYKIKNPKELSINKSHFPELLKQLMGALSKNTSNIFSAFKSTGIYTFNPQTVLKKLPDAKQDTEYSVEKSFIDYLKENRAPDPMKKIRNKKLDVPPGVSVTSDNFKYKVNLNFQIKNPKRLSNTLQPIPSTSKNNNFNIVSNILINSIPKSSNNAKKQAESSTDSDDDMKSVSRYSLLDPSDESRYVPSEIDSDYFVTDVESIKSNQDENEKNEISLNSFAIVKFLTEKDPKFYIGQVIKITNPSLYSMKFLRHKGKGIFSWPVVNDISIVSISDIEKSMPDPIKLRRGTLKFNLSAFSKYSIS